MKKTKKVKAQDLFQGIEPWENVHICYLLLPVPRIAQALMAGFPKEVCDKFQSALGSVIS